jgi:hypothetical protein
MCSVANRKHRSLAQTTDCVALSGVAERRWGDTHAVPLFRKKKPPVVSDDHAVITHLPLSDDEHGSAEEREAVFAIEDRLTEAAARLGGEHDGNEFGGGEAVLYTYGPDADDLFDAVVTCLGDFPILPGAYAVKRYGRADDADAREERVPLSS